MIGKLGPQRHGGPETEKKKRGEQNLLKQKTCADCYISELALPSIQPGNRKSKASGSGGENMVEKEKKKEERSMA